MRIITHDTSRASARGLRRGLAALAALALLVVPAGSGQADDTAIFTTAVPPNVLLFVDNSGSMNEIMYHPSFSPSRSSCEIFGWLDGDGDGNGGTSKPTSGSSSLSSTPYTCDPATQHCRFQVHENVSGFQQTGTVTCGANSQCGRGGSSGSTCKTGYFSRTFCGRTRNFYVDADTACKNNQTWYSEDYVEWYFSADADPYFLNGNSNSSSPNNEGNTSSDGTKIDANRNGTHYISNTPFPLFKRTRITAAKEIARDVVYRINTICPQGGGATCASDPTKQKNAVRFGIARFDDNAHGGFVSAAIDDYLVNRTNLDNAIGALDAQTSTPLAESLFKVFTYFMPRTAANLPKGKDGTTAFPKYAYSLSGSNTSSPPADPLRCPGTNAPCSCQKNFVIMITDGEPTNDNFACDGTCSSSSRTVGFNNFVSKLVGDYAPAGPPRGGDETETGYSGAGNGSRYLDDLALFMHENDFRPDLSGSQTMDVYTVGFATNAGANDLLQRAATNGDGLFFYGTQSQQLTDALTSSISDIIQKSQSFTAATVPASRTADGGNFYITQFVPSNVNPFWEGHLINFEITQDGKILDATGACAVDDPSGTCTSGSIRATATPFWDAADEVPAPTSRSLVVSKAAATPGAANSIATFTRANVSAADLGVTYPPVVAYPGSVAAARGGATNATKAEYLADEIVEYARGCELGTGQEASIPCVQRATQLGDIFHSNPVVVGKPTSAVNDPSYSAFRNTWATRDRLIWAGANDGFLHAFHAGTWQSGATPPAYDRGTGEERFAFMPWGARQNIRQLPIDTGSRDYYFVDGSPKAADVWFNPTPTSVTKAADGSEWHTVLVSGMRQGGRHYFALDVTDPASLGTGSYLWEFPRETDPVSLRDTMGETWGNAILTRVKVAASPTDDNGGAGYERWVAVVTGGYDPKGDPNSGSYDATVAAGTSRAGRAIYVLDAQTGVVLAQKRFDPTKPTGDPEREMVYAIPSTPAVYDLDFDGFADTIYVGDLGGNIWKWVISEVGHDTDGDATIDDWPFRKFFEAPKYPNAASPTRWKSFFFPPGATFKDQTLWIAIGSGERADLKYPGVPDNVDPTELENNRFYAITDPDPYDRQVPLLSLVTEADLTDVTDDDTCPPITNRGYYFRVGVGDFNGDGVDDEGEKFVTNVAVFAYYVFASTFTPTTSTDPCASGGTATLYVFRIYCGEPYFSTGTAPEKRRLNLGTGMPTDPRISISAGDAGGNGPCSGGHANKVFIITSDNKVNNDCMPQTPGGGVGVFYWRESP